MNVLIYFDGLRLGDSMMFMPALKALRKKLCNSHITIVCGICPAYEPLLHQVADKIHAPKSPYQSAPTIWQPNNIRDLYKNPYHLVIDTRSRLVTNLALRLIPCKRFVSKSLFSSHKKHARIGETLLDLFSKAVGKKLDPVFDWSFDEKTRFILEKHLGKIPDKPLIIIAPGSSTISRCVPIENLVATANKIKQAHFIFLLGPCEIQLNRFIRDTLSNGTTLENNDPFLTMALAENATITMANDSGGGHLLAATSRLHISLFNRSDYQKWLPWSKNQHPLVAKDLQLNHIREMSIDFLHSYINKLL